MSEQITTIEIRELLNAVQILATRPAAATEEDLGTALALSPKLVDQCTGGMIRVAYVANKGAIEESAV